MKAASPTRSFRLDASEIRIVKRLRYDLGYTISETAELVGRDRRTIGRIAPGRTGVIDNERLRDAFLASDMTASKLARVLGWGFDRDDSYWAPDSSRVKRVLGINDESSRGRRWKREMMSASMAVEMCEALGIPPEDVGAR